MRQKKFGLLLAVIGLFSAAAVVASAEDDGRTSVTDDRAWYMYFGDHPLGEGPFGFHIDAQYRIDFLFGYRRQTLLRPGLNFDVNDNVQLSGGYAYINDNSPKDSPPGFDVPENRFWEQLIVKQRIGSTRLTHRYRLEQRFIGNIVENEIGEGEKDGSVYKNRIRYFLKGTIPIGDSRYFASFYNEVMVNFGRNVENNIFDQNRAYGALGIRLNDSTNLELGYMMQIVQSGSGDVIQYNHTLQVGLFSSRALP